MNGLSLRYRVPPPSLNTAESCEPCAVSVKTKSTATKPTKRTPNVPKVEHNNKLLGKVKNLLRKKPVNNSCESPSWEVLLCNILAWVGALVIAGVVFRSLYLMYCKPEDV